MGTSATNLSCIWGASNTSQTLSFTLNALQCQHAL